MTDRVDSTIEPMLAKAVTAVPAHDSVPGGLLYEPKWDGFRAIIEARAGDDDQPQIEIGSRGGKSLTRYFPELVAELAAQLPAGSVLDGEIIVRDATKGGERLDWEALSQRIHPAETRIRKLSVETPASFVAFDLLQLDGEPLVDRSLRERRALLEERFAGLRAPLHVSQTTEDAELAERWLAEFEGAGLDGVVAKPLDAAYAPGKRIMLKIKHVRTADVVLYGYRIHKSGQGVGSLLLALYDETGELRGIGGASAFTNVKRLQLIDELAPLVERDESGEIAKGQGDRNRFSTNKDTSFVRLRPERVLEVKYDQMEGDRLRHAAQFLRWRPDRDPRSCTFEQLEVPAAYDFSRIVTG